MEQRFLGWLKNALLAGLVLALLAGFFIPVYSDEIGWRFQERAAIDGVDKLFSDLCGPNTLAVPPFFMMPVRYFSAYTNLWFADPFWVRISGILYALLWVGQLVVLIRRVAADGLRANVLTLTGLGLVALGTMPMLLVWSRPEQPLLLAMMAAMLIALKDWQGDPAAFASRDTAAKTAWLRSLAIALLALVAVSYHLKGILLVPVFLVSLYFAGAGAQARWPRIAAALAIVAMTVPAMAYWFSRLSCPDDPILNAFYAKHSLGAQLSGVHSPGDVLALGVFLIKHISFLEYIRLTAPWDTPMSQWVPDGQVTFSQGVRWYASLTAAWLLVGLLALTGAVRAGLASWRARHIDPRPVFAVLFFGAFCAWSASQGVRNVYEAMFVIPLLTLAVVMALSGAAFSGRLRSLSHVLAALLGGAALVSMVAMVMIWSPSLARSNEQAGYIEGQPHSVSVHGYPALERQVLETAKLCAIPEPAKAQGLLIDELTYFTFMRSRLPQHRLGVFGLWRGTIDDPLAYLESRKSDGIIMGCHHLPDDLRARAKSNGGFCCLSPVDWGASQ